MSEKDNKVKYNLKNVHWAELTDEETFEYGPVKPWPGAVSLSLSAEGDTNVFYADGIAYYTSVSNNGYTGDFESALVPDEFSEEIMKNTADANGVQLEDANVVPKAFALLFEFDGDVKAIRRVLYNCKMTRPSIESETTQGSIEPKTESGTLTATPLLHSETGMALVQGKTTVNTKADTYSAWYNQVYTPSTTPTA
jgi:phage major tail protein, phi13 family